MITSLLQYTNETRQQMCSLQNFISGLMICMANGLHSKGIGFTVIKKSCNLLNLGCVNLTQFTKDLHIIEQQYKNTHVSNYAEYLLLNVKKIKTLLDGYYPKLSNYTEVAIENLQTKIKGDGNVAGWPMTDSFYIWYWIHIISIDMDINSGYIDKKAFLAFIADLIACTTCRQHYLNNLNNLILSLQETTCTNALLALHTHINTSLDRQESNENIFKFKFNLVQNSFKRKYRNDYIELKIMSDK